MTLIDRITAAQPEDQRELIEEGAYLLRPVWLAVATDWNDPGCEQFAAMLNAGAYLDAVLLMLPEGWLFDMFTVPSGDRLTYSARAFPKDARSEGASWKATTMALAALGAILKAGGHDA